MAIKNIVVKRKPFAFNIGDTLFTCEFFGGQTLTVLSPVESNNGVEKVKVLCTQADKHQFYVGCEDYIFPGDLGVPGFAYDNRECSLFRSKAAAHAHAGEYSKWLSVSRYNDDDWTYRFH